MIMVGEVTIRIAADSFPIGKSMEDFELPHIFNSEKAREDLQEYLGDFLSDIGGDLSIRLYPFKNRMTVYLTMIEGDYKIKMDHGFSFDLPFSVIDKWDVPHFRNYIFGMWNAYVMALVDDDLELIVHKRDFEGKPRFMLEEEWVVLEEEDE